MTRLLPSEHEHYDNDNQTNTNLINETMDTPGRVTRSVSRQNSREPEPAGQASGAAAQGSRGGGRARQQQSPTKRAAKNTPSKAASASRPGIQSRASTAYGNVGRMSMPGALRTDRSGEQLLGEQMLGDIRETSAEADSQDDGPAGEQESDDEGEEEILVVQPAKGNQSRQTSSAAVGASATVKRRSTTPAIQPLRDARPLDDVRAPSEHDGTTTMGNADNYSPVVNVATDSSPPPAVNQPSYFTAVRERIIDAYHNRPALYHNRMEFNKENAWRWLIFLLPLLGPFFWAITSDANSASKPASYQRYEPVAAIKNFTIAAWSSVTSNSHNFNSSDPAYNTAFHKQLSSLTKQVHTSDSRIEKLEKSQKMHADTVAHLKSMLPNQLILHSANGRWTIPDSFYEAINDHIKASATDEPTPPSWDIFLRQNQADLKRFVHDAFGDYQEAISMDGTKRIATTAEVIDMLNAQFAAMTKKTRAENEEHWQTFQARAAEQRANTPTPISEDDVKQIVRGYFRNVWGQDLHGLVSSILVQNAELNLKTVNFFSVPMGALTDPALTSTTLDIDRPWYQNAWNRLMYLDPIGLMPTYRSNRPAIFALQRWEELGDCWCASAEKNPKLPWGTSQSGLAKLKLERERESQAVLNQIARHDMAGDLMSGYTNDHDLAPGQWGPKAQIAVVMPFTIYPRRITIEHMPSTSILDIGSAPRKIEVWAEIQNATARSLVALEAQTIFGRDDVPERPEATDPEHGIALSQEYVRIGWVGYDIRVPNHVQTGSLQVDLEALGVGVKKVVLRAVSNWGREYTCLYRLRMHGKVVDEDKNPHWVQDLRVTEDAWMHRVWPYGVRSAQG